MGGEAFREPPRRSPLPGVAPPRPARALRSVAPSPRCRRSASAPRAESHARGLRASRAVSAILQTEGASGGAHRALKCFEYVCRLFWPYCSQLRSSSLRSTCSRSSCASSCAIAAAMRALLAASWKRASTENSAACSAWGAGNVCRNAAPTSSYVHGSCRGSPSSAHKLGCTSASRCWKSWNWGSIESLAHIQGTPRMRQNLVSVSTLSTFHFMEFLE